MKKIILVVDDDLDVLDQVSLILGEHGYEVITADSESEAEKSLLTRKPDLAIVDVMMENKDSGFQLSYQIKRLYPDIPIIILTSVTSVTGIGFSGNTEEQRSWMKANLLLEKPVRAEKLHHEVKRLLS